MIHELAFYNPCNNGDIHVSRELVKHTMLIARERNPSCKFRYYHKNSPRLTIDIKRLEHMPLSEMPVIASSNDLRSFKYKDVVYFNTWYAASPIFKSMFCTLNTLHELFRENLREWFDHKIDMDAGKFLPTYEKRLFAPGLETHKVDEVVSQWYSSQWYSRVLLCNGQPMSGQTTMPAGHFEKAMQQVIDAHPRVLFIVTNPEVHQFVGDNVIFSRDITDVEGCDLPEIAYLSSFCNVIVGRGSGPYSFSLTRDNLTDPDKVFICFTDDERVARWVYMSDVVNASILWSSEYSVWSMQAIVNGVLEVSSKSAAEK